MELMNGLRGWALARPTVLIIAAPANESLKWQVEAEMDRRGWQPALSPAEAGLLLTIGTLPAPLSKAADVLWSQMPQPRYRQAIDETDINRQLDAAAAALNTPSAHQDNDLDAAAQLSQESDAGHEDGGMGDHEGHDMNHGGHESGDQSSHDMDSPGGHDMGDHVGHDMNHGGHESGDQSGHHADDHQVHDHAGSHMDHHGGHDMNHGGHEAGDHSGREMGGHEGHEMSHGGHEAGDQSGHDMDSHEGHDMSGHEGHEMGGHEHMHHGGEVAGLAMAGMAPDRDGLQLDELKVALGPILVGWPTGLVLKASMQGDVLTDVSLSWIGGIEGGDLIGRHSEDHTILLAVDALAQFALVAGWPRVARQARHARAMLSSNHPDERKRGHERGRAVARKISSSRLLAWSIGGLGDDRSSSQELNTPEGSRTGDVLDRVRALCAVVIGEDPSSSHGMPTARPENVEFLLEGVELAAARLIVASFVFEPSPAELHSGAVHA